MLRALASQTIGILKFGKGRDCADRLGQQEGEVCDGEWKEGVVFDQHGQETTFYAKIRAKACGGSGTTEQWPLRRREALWTGPGHGQETGAERLHLSTGFRLGESSYSRAWTRVASLGRISTAKAQPIDHSGCMQLLSAGCACIAFLSLQPDHDTSAFRGQGCRLKGL